MKTNRGDPPVVGRQRPLARLADAFHAHAGVLVTGDAGIGKSYLARAFARALEEKGHSLATAAGLAELRDLPLGALSPITGPAPDRSSDKAARAVAALQGTEVLLVDDVGDLDELSAVVLHRLATMHRNKVGGPWLLLTLRDGQPVPGALDGLLADGTIAQVRLRPFAETDVTELLEVLLQGPVAPRTAHDVFVRSGGNPLLVRELVAAGHDEEQWVRRPDGWTLEGSVTVADRLQPLVRGRWDRVSPAAVRTAEVLTLLGPLPVEVLHHLKVVSGVRELTAAGLAHTETDRVALTHPLLAQALLPTMDAADQEAVLRHARELLEAGWLPPSARVRLANALRVDPDLDPAALVDAAETALSIDEPEVARRLADAALRAGADEHRSRLLRASAGARLGDAADRATLTELARHGDPATRGAAAVSLSRLAVSGPQGPGQTLETLPASPQAPGASSMRAVAHLRRTEWRHAAAAAAQALDDAGDGTGWLDAAAIRSLLMVTDDDVAGGHALALRGLAMIDAGHSAGPEAPLLLAHAATLGGLLMGCPEQADEAARHCAPEVGRSRTHAGHRHMRRGYVEMRRGRLNEAQRQLSSALQLLRGSDPIAIRSYTTGLLAQTQAMRADLDTARRTLEQGWAEVPSGQASERLELVRAEACLAAASGDHAGAYGRLRWLLDNGEDTPVRAALVRLDLARLGDVAGAADGVLGSGAATKSPVIAAIEELVLAAVAGDTGAVLHAAHALTQAGLHLWAADLLASAANSGACKEPEPLRARTLAITLACDGAATPALATLPERLTPSQRRVALLAARGHKHRDIGAQLGMSPRTSATHLHRVYRLLGVNSREELARLIG